MDDMPAGVCSVGCDWWLLVELDSSLFIGLAHEALFSYAMRPWIGRVYLEDNWSDEPPKGG